MKPAAPFLARHIDQLPKGRALDLAAGSGRNAVFLADHGFEVDAIDISAERLQVRHPRIRTIEADLETYDLGVERYDVVVNFYYLQRSLKIREALKPGGVVVFETFLVGHPNGPRNLAYYLQPGELREMFSGLDVLHYTEADVASLVARRASGTGTRAATGL